VKRSPLVRRVPLSRGPLERSPQPKKRRATFTPASTAQRAKVQGHVCAVCRTEPVDPAHLTPRAFRGCDHEDCVIGLCRPHHRAFDDGTLDLLPYVAGQGFTRELAHMQGHYDDPLSVVYRLSGCRWAPIERAA
jgi:hypothetical protein